MRCLLHQSVRYQLRDRKVSARSEWPWLIAGTALLMASCALVLFAYQDTVGRFPIPMYQVALHFLVPYSLLFVLPLAFWGSFGFLWQGNRFGVMVLAITAVIGLLDGMWALCDIGGPVHTCSGVRMDVAQRVMGVVIVSISLGLIVWLSYRLLRWARSGTGGAHMVGAVLTEVTQSAAVHEANRVRSSASVKRVILRPRSEERVLDVLVGSSR